MKIKKLALPALLIALTFASCKKPKPVPPRGDYDGGYLVLNEGQFMHDNASLSFLKKDFSEQEDSVYYKTNNENIGDVGQSLFAEGNKLYILVNNSNKIIVANRWKMEKLGEMASLIKSPRYMTKVSDGKAVVSNWGEVFDSNWQDVEDDFLAFVNTDSDVVTDTVHIDLGPGKMLYLNGNLYVLISGVSQSRNKVAVVDPASESIRTYLTVGDRPSDIVKDNDDNLWVLSSGNAAWTGNETPSTISKINPATNQVEFTQVIASDKHPQFLFYANGQLYLIMDNKIKSLTATASSVSLSDVADISQDVTTVYGVNVIDDKLFVTDAVDYQQPGKVVVYDLNNNFAKTGTFVTGYLPNGVLKNY